MLNTIPARKIGMTTAQDDEGNAVPVTLLQPYAVHVTQIKRQEKDGYNAVQVAFQETRAKLVNRPNRGVLKAAGVAEDLGRFFEWRCSAEQLTGLTLGQRIAPQDFLDRWDNVSVQGTSKGKGFAGAMKRWGFRGQQRTHGDPDNRRPMSNNATDPARVFKGSRRPGRMGHDTVTIKGLTVFDYDPEMNLLAISGSVPGPAGGLLFVNMLTQRTAEDIAALEEAHHHG